MKRIDVDVEVVEVVVVVVVVVEVVVEVVEVVVGVQRGYGTESEAAQEPGANTKERLESYLEHRCC